MEKRRINVRAIIWREGKLLGVLHKDDEGNPSPYWAVSGGGLDPGETLQEGVRREVMEELGIEATVGELLFIQQFPSSRKGFDEELEFFFHIHDTPLFDTIDLASTSHGNDELSCVEFIDPKNAPILPSFLSELDTEAYIRGEHPVYISSEL